jgi:hypothetical protein
VWNTWTQPSDSQPNVEEAGDQTAWLCHIGLIPPKDRPQIQVLTDGAPKHWVLCRDCSRSLEPLPAIAAISSRWNNQTRHLTFSKAVESRDRCVSSADYDQRGIIRYIATWNTHLS